MEYKSFKIDLTALAALIGVIGGLFLQILAAFKRKKGKEKKDEG